MDLLLMIPAVIMAETLLEVGVALRLVVVAEEEVEVLRAIMVLLGVEMEQPLTQIQLNQELFLEKQILCCTA